MKKRFAIILAAGQGTRMKSALYKVLHPILGKPMLQYVIEALKQTSLQRMITIVGHGAEKVKKTVGKETSFALQAEQLGTAHAVMQAESELANKDGTTLVVCGDTPLITPETFNDLFSHHEASGAAATILTTKVQSPTGYGRIVRDSSNNVQRIVEEKDANEAEKQIKEINTGTYCFDNKLLFQALKRVDNNNAQQEYYLPDVIEILQKQGEHITAFAAKDEEETIGINDRFALSEAEQVMQRRINKKHLLNGVTMMDRTQTYIGPDVTIGEDVVLYPGTIIMGDSSIGSHSTIGPHSEIEHSTIGKHTTVRQSTISHSKIGNRVTIGPYAHIRPESIIEDEVRIGNFVEIKKSKIGKQSKVPHHSYIGDTVMGERVNIGSGTITVNYDGQHKHETKIGDDSFIGCNTNLVAPVSIEPGAYVAAGSTITRNVPSDSLAIARAKQQNKDGYVTRILNRK